MSGGECTNEQVTRESAGDLLVRDVMVATPKTVPADGSVGELRRLFENPHVRMALLVDGPHFAGIVRRDDLPADASDEAPAREFARREIETIAPDAPATTALSRLDERGERRLVVLDPDGRTLSGLVCLTKDRNGFCQS